MANYTATQNKTQKGPPKFLADAIGAINSGQHDKAIEIFKQGIDCNRLIAYAGIGDIYRVQGKYEESLKWLEKAHKHKPDALNVLDSIGRVLTKLNRQDEAVEIMCKALKRQKNVLDIRSLVESMRKQGKGEKAAEVLEKMVVANPKRLDFTFELAFLYDNMAQYDKAEQHYNNIIKLVPHAITYDRLGCLCLKTERISESISYLRKAHEMLPDNISIQNDLAAVLLKSGEEIEGSRLLQNSIEKAPMDMKIHSTFLYHMHLLPDLDQQTIFDAHKQWGIKQAPLSLADLSHNNTPDPHRKLRIGYISPDFRKHPVTLLFEVLLDAHNRDVVEIYGYGNVEHPDEITHKLEGMFNSYQNIYGLSDDMVAGMIRHDKIDILVDLAGHTLNHRLLVLARKPAPVQVTYLGYFDTTGMPQVDYVLTDEMLNPPQSQKYYTEQLAYLPGGVCFYRSRIDTDLTPPPVMKNGFVTFGAFTNNLRFNDKLFETWSEILKSVPNSRLLLGFTGGDEEAIQARYLKKFEKFGVSRDTIKINGRRLYHEYVKQYANVDITFDTFPENGGTTTCESLWMGAPVISMFGEHQNGRGGLTILSRIGLGEFAVPTIAEYIAKAVELAKNPKKIAEMRASMRSRMTNSVLCDSKRLAAEVEAAYRKMWYKWCQKQGVTVPSE